MKITPAKAGIKKIKPHMISLDELSSNPVSIFLNSNESAYGASPFAKAAAIAATSNLERYYQNPDLEIAPMIAAKFGLCSSNITIGQGADDLIARLARAYLGPGSELIRSMNGYLKVPNYAHANDATVVSIPDDNFVPSVDRIINALNEKTRIVYLANPENPAGTYLSGLEVRRLHRALPPQAILLLDSAYEEYVDALDYEPGHSLVKESDNVVMCRTFSKIFGLAGARIGWLYAPEHILDVIRRIGLTFPVSSTSIAAAVAALEDTNHFDSVYKATRGSRGYLTTRLAGIGLNPIPSQTNFVLVGFHNREKSASQAYNYLRENGIAVRRFSSQAFVDYIRISIGLPHEIDMLIETLERFMAGGSK